MNFIDYEKIKLSEKSPEEICWKLFELTGQVNYYLFYRALQGAELEQEWTNLESKEL